jgi:DNA-binding transcriptional ArsR family regulator
VTAAERKAAIERVERRERLAKLRRDVDAALDRWVTYSYDEQRVLVGMYRSMTGGRPGISDVGQPRIDRARRRLEKLGLVEQVEFPGGVQKPYRVDGEARFGPLTRHGAHVARGIHRERAREFALDELGIGNALRVRPCTGKPAARPALPEDVCCFFPVYDSERRSGERIHNRHARGGPLWIFRLETVMVATDRAAWSIRRHLNTLRHITP